MSFSVVNYRLSRENKVFIFLLAETNSLKADEEEELAAEKKKNLQIMGSLLNINLEQPKPNKTATNVKKFKYESSTISKEGGLRRLRCFRKETERP